MLLPELPAEVRMMIWGYVFNDQIVYVDFTTDEEHIRSKVCLMKAKTFHKMTDMDSDHPRSFYGIEFPTGVYKLTKQSDDSGEVCYLVGELFR
jgi:hypothetical protein